MLSLIFLILLNQFNSIKLEQLLSDKIDNVNVFRNKIPDNYAGNIKYNETIKKFYSPLSNDNSVDGYYIKRKDDQFTFSLFFDNFTKLDNDDSVVIGLNISTVDEKFVYNHSFLLERYRDGSQHYLKLLHDDEEGYVKIEPVNFELDFNFTHDDELWIYSRNYSSKKQTDRVPYFIYNYLIYETELFKYLEIIKFNFFIKTNSVNESMNILVAFDPGTLVAFDYKQKTTKIPSGTAVENVDPLQRGRIYGYGIGSVLLLISIVIITVFIVFWNRRDKIRKNLYFNSTKN